MKIKKFFKKWWQGIKDLPPLEQFKAKRIGFIGNIVGIIFAWIFLILMNYWFFSIVLFFAIFLQTISLIEVNQQIKQAKLMNAQIEKFKKAQGEQDVESNKKKKKVK